MLRGYLRDAVRVPLMPKGVEHKSGQVAVLDALRESSFDAERR